MISFENVYKSFGSNKVLQGLNLSIFPGRITFIIGKSGEGKSVTIKHILGLMRPDSGQVIVNEKKLSSLTEEELQEHRLQFGMLFQHAALFDSLSVIENVLFPLQEQKAWPKDKMKLRARDVLRQVGLHDVENKYPDELATGEKKRVGLARALATQPKIILYDEPTTGMDPLICEMIDQLIVDVNREERGLTSIVISHDIKAAMATADHIIMLYKGCVIEEGSPSVMSKSLNPIVQQFLSGRVDGPMELV